MTFDKKFTHQYRVRGRGPTGNDFPEVLQIGFGGYDGIVANRDQLVFSMRIAVGWVVADSGSAWH